MWELNPLKFPYLKTLTFHSPPFVLGVSRRAPRQQVAERDGGAEIVTKLLGTSAVRADATRSPTYVVDCLEVGSVGNENAKNSELIKTGRDMEKRWKHGRRGLQLQNKNKLKR